MSLISWSSSLVNWLITSGLFTHCIQPPRLWLRAPKLNLMAFSRSKRSMSLLPLSILSCSMVFSLRSIQVLFMSLPGIESFGGY